MKRLLVFSILFISLFLNAQEYNFFLGNDFSRDLFSEIIEKDTIIHTSFKPLRVGYVKKKTKVSFFNKNKKRLNFSKKMPLSFFWKKLFAEDLIIVDQPELKFSINPLFNYHKKFTKNKNKYSQNSRGFFVKGSIGKKLSFYTDFFENQAYFLPYIDQKVNKTLVAPGQGVWKPFGDDKTGKDYNYASGYLSFSPFNFLNFQAGHSKHFIGSGYRSLLLSDNGVAYPFFKTTFTKDKWQYTVMFTEFEDFKRKYYFYHYKKHGSFVFLNYSPFPNIEIGFFEGIIWRTSDDSSYTKKIPPLYFLPVPGVREVFYGLNSQNNAILGLNTRVKVFKYTEIYGQFAIDDFKEKNFNKRYSYQAGFKIYDLFFDRINNQSFFIQSEYNYSRPYMYTNKIAHSAYTNFNEPLAHTLGAGFKEFIAIIDWSLLGFHISFKFNNIETSTDTAGTNFGTNLLLSDNYANFKNTLNFVGQGNSTHISNYCFSLAYTINTATNLQLFVDLNRRNFLSEINDNELFFVSFGIKNSIKNFYTDY